MSSPSSTRLVRHIGLGQGTALYVSAILGAGVLVLPGQVASLAGPASLVSWGVACALGAPLAAMFAALARRHPDAGGVATYVEAAFGPTMGGLTGWLYFTAGSVGQTIVPLTGGYYVVHAVHLGDRWAVVVALVILALAVAANLAGARIGSRAQVVLAVSITAAMLATIAAAMSRASVHRLTPFAPHGLLPIGQGVVVLFFAFAGWEAVAHLAEEFTDPGRDLPRAVALTVVIVTLLYVGLAWAVVSTGTYGTPDTDHVAVQLLLETVFGNAAGLVAAAIAVVISLGTTNAFVAGVSRLGYSLARSGWLPSPVGRISRTGVPVGGVLSVALVAIGGLLVAAVCGWGTETLVVVPSTLVVAVYLLAAAAGLRVLRGAARGCAAATVLVTLLVVPTVVHQALIPVVVAAIAVASRLGLRAWQADRHAELVE